MRHDSIDRAAFEALVRAHHAEVYRSALRITRDRERALDVAQQVFVALLEGRIRVDEAGDAAGVLRWFAVRSALASLRAARRMRRREDAYAMDHEEARPDVALEHEEQRRALDRLVAALPDELRLAVELRFRESMTLAQVGAALEVSESVAHERVRRALERLRRELDRLGLTAFAIELERELVTPPEVAVPTNLAARLLAAQTSAHASASASIVLAPAFLLAIAATVALCVWIASPSEQSAEHVAASSIDGAQSVEGAGPVALDATEGEAARERIAPAAPAATTVSRSLGTTPSSTHTPGSATAHVRGRVVDELGLGVGDLTVIAAPPGKGDMRWREHATTTTKPDGSYALDFPTEEERTSLELAIDSDTFSASERPLVRVSRGESANAGDLAVARISNDPAGAFTLALRLVDADERPIARAPVRLFRRGRNVFGRVGEQWEAGGLTDASGLLELAGEHLGDKLLVIDARELGWRLLRERVRVDATGRHELRVRLERGAVLAGHVRTLDGAPVAKAILRIEGDDLEAGASQIESDEHGRFRFVGLEPGACRVWIAGTGSDGAVLSQARVTLDAPREDVDLRLKRDDDARDVGEHLAELHGRLVDAHTRAPVLAEWDAVDVARVESTSNAEFLAREAATLVLEVPVQQMEGLQPPPPPRSEFHLTGLEPGNYVVIARIAGRAVSFAGPFQLGEPGASGAPCVVAQIELAIHAPIRVTGVVRDAAGNAVPGATIVVAGARHEPALDVAALDEEVRRSEGHPRRAYDTLASGADGSFTLAVPPGIGLRFVALHPRFAPAESELVARTERDTTLEIRLTRAR